MIKFRTALLKDAESIAKLVNSAYRGEYSKQGWTTEADILDGQRTDPESLKVLLKDPSNQFEVAYDSEDPNKILGSIHLVLDLPQTLYFGMLTIEPSLQNKGLGKKLLDHIESFAKTKNISQIRISVIHLRTELIAYYERRGFRATGLWEAFPENDPLFGIPKVKGLKLLEFIKKLQT